MPFDHPYFGEKFSQVTGQSVGAVDRAVLASSSAEGEHQMAEAALDISCNVFFSDRI